MAKGIRKREGVGSAHTTRRRESRSPEEGADEVTESAQETLSGQDGPGSNDNLTAGNSKEGRE
jgi:hypothetical protein